MRFLRVYENLGRNSFILWNLNNLIFAILFCSIDLLTFKYIFDSKIKNSKFICLIVLDSILRLLGYFLLPIELYRFLNIVISILIFKFGFKENIEEAFYGEATNCVIIVSIECVLTKLLFNHMPNLIEYANAREDLLFNLIFTTCFILIRFIVLSTFKIKKLKCNMDKSISIKDKWSVLGACFVGLIAILFTAYELLHNMRDVPFNIFLINILSLNLCYYISIQNLLRMKKSCEDDRYIETLSNCNKTLQLMYDNIRGFKHDYTNFVLALSGCAETNNLNGLKKLSETALEECRIVSSMEMLNPKLINNSAIYSILTNKYYVAKEFGIDMNIEVLMSMNEDYFYTQELCRIFGILLDNAIEAANECEEKIINVIFKQDKNKKLIIVENSYQNKDIKIDDIFKKGYSTKTFEEGRHGLGLWNVRNILRRNTSLDLFTTKGDLFSQQLEIYC